MIMGKDRLRILFYTRIFGMARGGAENYVVRLCQALAQRQHDVHVIADRFFATTGITLHQDTTRIDWVREQVKPDLTVDWGFFQHADVHRLGGGIHKYVMQYSLNAFHGPHQWLKGIGYRFRKHRIIINRQRELLRHSASIFLANSRMTADQTIAAGAKDTAVSVLHNGVDTKLFCPKNGGDKRVINLREAWGLSSNDVAVLYVAHNHRLKNFSVLRRAFTRLAGSFPHIKLVVIGKRPPHRMPPNTIYAGEHEDMPTCYQAADCLAHPAFFDSCANVVLEAMSCGLPVVVSDRCGANELVHHGQSGFVLPVAGNQDVIIGRWTQQVLSVYRDTSIRERLGAAAREAMLENDLEHYVTRFESFLQKALSAKHSTQ
jgi:UDP-glucose:(heptosyl)LPS alpha-1,3-glucosyltransferase